MKQLQENVIKWASDRGIFEKATPQKQAFKTLEECGELIHAIGAGDADEIKDAVGDIIVTLIIQCEMQGLTIEDCLRSAYDVIKNRQGSMVNGMFVKNL